MVASTSSACMMASSTMCPEPVEGQMLRLDELSAHDDVVETYRPAWTQPIALSGGSPGSRTHLLGRS